MADEPELYLVEPPDPGQEWRAERARHQAESRRRAVTRLGEAVAHAERQATSIEDRAALILDGFLTVRSADGSPCACSCHPRLPDGDLHDYGDDCPCQLTVEERRARNAEMFAAMDEFWTTPEGQEITAARAADGAELDAWLAATPDFTVTSHGGLAPEQWWGTVDGRSFYFRERHDEWRIELDLRPSGRHVRAWNGSDLDAEESFEPKEIEEGVIAEGTISADGYGRTSVERARFILDKIRIHVRRQSCEVHIGGLDDLELLLGRPVDWCPACGVRLSAGGTGRERR